ncbi:MAG: site-specific integrase [Psychroserpens sp.]|uniref:tyrosine-type recombinase/integrase n=1 Tax=Psychroserpens sp. TaxID=2020870 RepID=UPI003C7409E1
MTKKKTFSIPKIYDANGDLNKRWYLYFSFRDPNTGKLKRMKNIYGKVNSYKTKESRYIILAVYKRRLVKLLRSGFDPFADNSQTHKVFLNDSKIANSNQSDQKDFLVPSKTLNSVEDSISLVLVLKVNSISKRTLTDYRSRCEMLIKWLKANNVNTDDIRALKKKTIIDFLNSILIRTSSRNRNNYRTCLSSIFQAMEENELIDKNFVKNINRLKTIPKRNKTYSLNQQEEIFEYLSDVDPILLLYIKFISFNFLRPIEVCRLKVEDIDLDNGTLQFQAKNKSLKTKIIPKILLDDLPKLDNRSGSQLLFTPNDIGGDWDTELTNRRDYFSKRFKTVVKDHFGLSENYGLYSFRHTFITKIYRSLVGKSSPFSAKSELMQITGHSSMTALEKYLRDIDAELPKDYSNHL